jgi:hypothetical protein
MLFGEGRDFGFAFVAVMRPDTRYFGFVKPRNGLLFLIP